jgi:hypothetical protein
VNDSFITKVRVAHVERRRQAARTDHEGNITWDDLGWFVILEGSQVALGLGFHEPAFKEGDLLEFTLRLLRSA